METREVATQDVGDRSLAGQKTQRVVTRLVDD